MTTKTKNNLLLVVAVAVMCVMTIGGALTMGIIGGVLGFGLFWAGAIFFRGEDDVVVENSLLPLGGFYCINICGYLLTRGELSEEDYNHEGIHTDQMKEMGYIGFYLWYLGEWFYQWVWSFFDGTIDAYKMVTFEQEAYANDQNLSYREGRESFASLGYLFSREVYS